MHQRSRTSPAISNIPAVLRRGGTRRSGVVLVLVLSVLAVAGILAYSLLVASAMDAQSAAYARATMQAEAMAENGVNLAMHYLRNPEDSPVALVKGAAGDWHYPGQANVALGEDSFTVAVTNVAAATYVINATGQSRDADGNPCTRKLRVRVVGMGDWAARGAILFASNLSLEADVLVDGNLVTSGQFNPAAGTVTGMKRASNYGSYTADPTWGAPPVLPELTVPTFASLDLVRAATERGGYYVYNNMRCQADYVTSSLLLSPPAPSAGNPGRVFLYTGALPLTLAGLSSQNFDGTLVLTQADLVVQNSWRFRPQSGMPGLLVSGRTSLTAVVAELRVEGIYYNGKGFALSTTLSSNPVRVEGTMLCPVTTAQTLGTNVAGPLRFEFDADNVAVPDFTDQGIRYTRLQIEDWEQVN